MLVTITMVIIVSAISQRKPNRWNDCWKRALSLDTSNCLCIYDHRLFISGLLKRCFLSPGVILATLLVRMFWMRPSRRHPRYAPGQDVLDAALSASSSLRSLSGCFGCGPLGVILATLLVRMFWMRLPCLARQPHPKHPDKERSE